MNKMIAGCGLVCTDCPAYITTRNNDDNRRKKTAESWSKMLNADIKSVDINCDGGLSISSRLLSHCFECEIRKCCRGKTVVNCTLCSEFPCKKYSTSWPWSRKPNPNR